MLIDRSHRPWLIFSLVALLVCGAAYGWYAAHAIDGPDAASLPGLVFGILGTLFMVFAGSLGLRRCVRSWRIGSGQAWLRAHLWLGALSLPLIWFHAGFHHGGPLTAVMMYTFYAVVISGILGLLLQQIMPNQMTLDVPNETLFNRVPTAQTELTREAERLVSHYETVARRSLVGVAPGSADAEMAAQLDNAFNVDAPATVSDEQRGPLADFYRGSVRAYLTLQPSTADDLALSSAFTRARAELPPSAQAPLARLEELCREHHQLCRQRRLHVLLHGWLYVHVPLSMALLILTAVHIVMALKWAL